MVPMVYLYLIGLIGEFSGTAERALPLATGSINTP